MSVCELLIDSGLVRPRHYHDANLSEATGLFVFVGVLVLLVVLFSWSLWESRTNSLVDKEEGPTLRAGDEKEGSASMEIEVSPLETSASEPAMRIANIPD